MNTPTQHFDYLDSPLGMVEVRASKDAVTAVYFVDKSASEANPNRVTAQVKQQLKEYFCGRRQRFDLPLAPTGTSFQQKVWAQLLQIPYGQTCSYGHIAKKLNKPKAVRAIGAANGKNPISILVPCHRVIGASGKLTGYAGGLDRKAWLLALENAQRNMLG